MSGLGLQRIFCKGGSFSVVDKYLGCTFICTSRASGRGIIMETGSTDLSSEQSCIVTNWLFSPFKERMSLGFGFSLQMKSQNLEGSSLCRIYTPESSLCLSGLIVAFHDIFLAIHRFKIIVKEYYPMHCFLLQRLWSAADWDHSYFANNVVISSMNLCSKCL